MDLDRAIVVEITQASQAKTALVFVPTAVAPGSLLAIVEAVNVTANTTRADAAMAVVVCHYRRSQGSGQPTWRLMIRSDYEGSSQRAGTHSRA